MSFSLQRLTSCFLQTGGKSSWSLKPFIHLFSHKRKKYLAVRRGKHRIPGIIPDEDKYFLLKFPGLNIPILPDVDGEDSSYSKLPKDFDDNGTNILDEVLN